MSINTASQISLRAKDRISELIFIDFFAIKPSERITFHHKNQYSTTLGILSSWIIIILSVLTFVSFGSNMFYHTNPKSMVSQIVTPDPKNYELLPNNFFFAFGLEDLTNKSQHFIDETFYKVQIIKRTKIMGNISLEYLETNKCDIEMVPDHDELRNYFLKNNIDSLYCIKNYSNVVPELKGTWDGELYKNLLVNIIICSNNTEENKCKPIEVIEKKINNANFALYFSNLAVDPSNFDKPIMNYGRELYTPISFNTLTNIEMHFEHLLFETDKGFAFEDKETIEKVHFVSSRQVTSFNPSAIVQIDMKLSKVITIYSRKYDKLQEILASLGGIIKALMMVMRFLVIPFIQFDFKKALTNSLFNFDIKEEIIKKTKDIKNFNLNKKKKITSLRKITSLKSQKPNIPHENLYQDCFVTEEKKIDISSFQYYFSSVKNNLIKFKTKLLNKGLSQIDKTLDIEYIIEKLLELDKLKMLILTKEQLNLFNFIPKPILSLEHTKNEGLLKKITNQLERNLKFKAEKAFKALKIMNSNHDKNEIDKKLIEIVSARVKNKNFIKKNSQKLEDAKNKNINKNGKKSTIINSFLVKSNFLNSF